MIVCLCRRVSEQEIRVAAKELDAKTIEELQQGIQICDNCCVCSECIECILKDSSLSTG